jgi:hypothetical protein
MISPSPSTTPSPNTTDILLTELEGGNAQVAIGIDSPGVQGGIGIAVIAVILVVAAVASQFLRGKKTEQQKLKTARATRTPMRSDTLTAVSTGETATSNPALARPIGGAISIGPVTRASIPMANHAANLQMFAAPKRAGVPVRNPITSAAMKQVTRTGGTTLASRALSGETIQVQERARFGAQQVRQAPRVPNGIKPTTVQISADGQHINQLKSRAVFQAIKPTTK